MGLGENDRRSTIVSNGHPLADALGEVDSHFSKPFIPVGTHQMLGWPACYGDPAYRCRLAAALLGKDRWDEEVNAEAARWLPLLAVGDNRDLYLDGWADGGSLFFVIRDDRLAAADFDECWCVLLST